VVDQDVRNSVCVGRFKQPYKATRVVVVTTEAIRIVLPSKYVLTFVRAVEGNGWTVSFVHVFQHRPTVTLSEANITAFLLASGSGTPLVTIAKAFPFDFGRNSRLWKVSATCKQGT